LIAKLSADLYRFVGAVSVRGRTMATVLPWGLGQAGPTASASESIRRHILAGSILVGLLVIGLGGWATTARISGALIAQGSIVVDTNVKKVQHPTGGVVGELFVHDGDHVKAGDVLLRLDETVTRANLSIVNKGLIEFYARKARLAAERDGADSMAAPPELAGRLNDPDVKEALASASFLTYATRTVLAKSNNCRSALPSCNSRSPALRRSSRRRTRGSR
jgi:multidrug efflux pump subunit AcrA (membrane-fusion protein)